MKGNLFYCYSKRLNQFLSLFGVGYIDKNYNCNTQAEYYTYERTNKLDFLLKKWEEIKQGISLESVHKKEH